MHFDWNSFYLICFGVGLVLTLLSVLTGFGSRVGKTSKIGREWDQEPRSRW